MVGQGGEGGIRACDRARGIAGVKAPRHSDCWQNSCSRRCSHAYCATLHPRSFSRDTEAIAMMVDEGSVRLLPTDISSSSNCHTHRSECHGLSSRLFALSLGTFASPLGRPRSKRFPQHRRSQACVPGPRSDGRQQQLSGSLGSSLLRGGHSDQTSFPPVSPRSALVVEKLTAGLQFGAMHTLRKPASKWTPPPRRHSQPPWSHRTARCSSWSGRDSGPCRS